MPPDPFTDGVKAAHLALNQETHVRPVLGEPFKCRTVACIGTGPSLRREQISAARNKGFALVGCNFVWHDVPDLDVLWATNHDWWQSEWGSELESYPAQKWTVSREAADKFSLNWIAEKDAPGLSSDPRVIHHGHGSGYSMLNLAYLMGAARIVLLGYDLKYAPDYDGRNRRIGSSPRHYFGEYAPHLQHWPSVCVKDGVHFDLVSRYGEVAKQAAVEIINCTPASALKCFPSMDIECLQ